MRVCILYQHDPTAHYSGGIGTFINTFIKYAPADFDISLVGVAVDPRAHPVGAWHRVRVAGRPVEFLPIVAAHPALRDRVPLSLRYTWALKRYWKTINVRDAVIELHRIEPGLALKGLTNPKILFLHVHPEDLCNPMTEVAWGRWFPWLYFWLERQLIKDMARVFLVRQDAVGWYRNRYPNLAERFSFLPTWMDEEVFVSLPEGERRWQKQELARAHGLDPNDRLLLFVGRFEGQKDPLRLLQAFRQVNGRENHTRLVMIGEGALEGEIRGYLAAHRLTGRVSIVRPQPQSEIAKWMNAADCLCLSSAFEGMPRVVIEALRCGLPVVSTAVGEVPRVLTTDQAGRLVRERTPEALGAAIGEVLRQPPDREACQEQGAPFTAKKILGQVYASYRTLGQQAG
ncbi:MAG: glycosyltransferase family 4 protein [Candidatus Omnitrophica bacterium]|nr:glycosyltransferase family 4 protein [Candidatus Omnitrophota bacterium]